jgi:hypothetical protein
MDEKNKQSTGYSVERVTFNGVELPLVPMSNDANETQVERIFTAFAALDQGEKPSVIISTTTPMV